MTREKYLDMCSQLGDEPDPDKLPPSFEDFPSYVHSAFEIYNALPDNYNGGHLSFFCGKDYSCIDTLFELYEIPKEDRLDTFRVVQLLNNREKKQARKRAEKAAKTK